MSNLVDFVVTSTVRGRTEWTQIYHVGPWLFVFQRA